MQGEGGRSEDHGEGYGPVEGYEPDGFETARLGHDLRFVLAAVGGGGIRVARAVARRHLRYLETVAINCDPRVQELEEFDRRICLAPGSGAEGDTGGAATIGSELARAAVPALHRVFEGAQFVTIVASLGGGSGTGALPWVLESAARSAAALKLFVIKPFECEGERRALADRTLARLHFVEPFVEKRESGQATLQVLDNESLARSGRSLPIAHLDRYWGELVAALIERELIQPAEAVLNAERASAFGRAGPLRSALPRESGPAEAEPLLPIAPRLAPVAAQARPDGVELTFEVLRPSAGDPTG